MFKNLRNNTFYIYTDGSSLSNPRSGGIGVRFVLIDNEGKEHRRDINDTGYLQGNSQQMELCAVIHGLKSALDLDTDIYFNYIEIRSDSNYVVNNWKTAINIWPNTGWTTSSGWPVENVDLWKTLTKLILKVRKHFRCNLDFIKVKAHSSDQDNRAVDKLAKSSARTPLKKLSETELITRKLTDQLAQKGSLKLDGKRVTIRIIGKKPFKEHGLTRYRYEVVSKRSQFKGQSDFVFSDQYMSRGNYYYVVFGKDERYPIIAKIIRKLNKQ